MKSRNGFVSNSSSSSFILAIKDSEVCPQCGRSLDETLLEAVERLHCSSDDNEIICIGAEHLLYEINRDERDGSRYVNSDFKKEIEAYKDKKGWTVVRISISNHCEELREKIAKMEKNGEAIRFHDPEDD